MVKNSLPMPEMLETWVQFLDQENLVTHSSSLVWSVPKTEECGRPQSIGSQIVGHDCSNFSTSGLKIILWEILEEVIWKVNMQFNFFESFIYIESVFLNFFQEYDQSISFMTHIVIYKKIFTKSALDFFYVFNIEKRKL